MRMYISLCHPGMKYLLMLPFSLLLLDFYRNVNTCIKLESAKMILMKSCLTFYLQTVTPPGMPR